MMVLMFVPKIKGVSMAFRPLQASCSELYTNDDPSSASTNALVLELILQPIIKIL